MNITNHAGKIAAIVAGTALLSSIAVVSSGTAQANSLEELLNIIRQESHEISAVAADDVVQRSRVALRPAADVAQENNAELLRVKAAACKVNSWQHKGLKVDTYLRDNYTPYEQNAIWEQANEFQSLQTYDENGYAIVNLICKATD
jgi:hypothetical protein